MFRSNVFNYKVDNINIDRGTQLMQRMRIETKQSQTVVHVINEFIQYSSTMESTSRNTFSEAFEITTTKYEI